MAYDLLRVEGDAKTVKGTKQGILTGILYLAPSTEADGQHDLCMFASDECRKACLNTAGRAGIFPSIRNARVRKTLEYLADYESFKARLAKDVAKLQKEARRRNLKPAVRINGTSDIPKLAMQLAAMFPEVQF